MPRRAPSDSGRSRCCRSPAGRPRVTRAFPSTTVGKSHPKKYGVSYKIVNREGVPHRRPGGGWRDAPSRAWSPCPLRPALALWGLGLPTTKPHSRTPTVTAQCFFWKGFEAAVPNHCSSPRLCRRGQRAAWLTRAGTLRGRGGRGQQLPRVGRHLCVPCLPLPARGRVRSPVDGNVWNPGGREEKEDHVRGTPGTEQILGRRKNKIA